MPELSGAQINLNGCTYRAEGETAAEVLRKMVRHLEDEHGMTLPDPKAILAGDVDETRLDRGVRLVLDRIRDHLDLIDKGIPDRSVPPIVPPPVRSE